MLKDDFVGLGRRLYRPLEGLALRLRRLRLGDPPGYCCACRREVLSFLPYRRGEASRSPLMRTLDVIGSDVERHACPKCGAHDRERHLLLYFQRVSPAVELRGARILHFAPETSLSQYFQGQSPSRYVRADLMPAQPDIEVVDLSRMPYADTSYDLVVANHVLEHVIDDRRALSEIVRVLRPGGAAVLQTPFSALLTHTIEDPDLQPAGARRALFGQEDHVRLYGRDFEARVCSAGLISCVGSHTTLLPDIEPRRYGVNPREPLMLFRKPN